jgi:hypothetical protein
MRIVRGFRLRRSRHDSRFKASSRFPAPRRRCFEPLLPVTDFSVVEAPCTSQAVTVGLADRPASEGRARLALYPLARRHLILGSSFWSLPPQAFVAGIRTPCFRPYRTWRSTWSRAHQSGRSAATTDSYSLCLRALRVGASRARNRIGGNDSLIVPGTPLR